MPTLFREHGYRFSFYSYDLGEPMHVHVTKGGCETKIWMASRSAAWNHGFHDHELAEILELVESRRNLIESAWNERSGN